MDYRQDKYGEGRTESQMNRRGFIAGVGILIAAPAVVKASSLMPVRSPKIIIPHSYTFHNTPTDFNFPSDEGYPQELLARVIKSLHEQLAIPKHLLVPMIQWEGGYNPYMQGFEVTGTVDCGNNYCSVRQLLPDVRTHNGT
jgi:hypothetical protein